MIDQATLTVIYPPLLVVLAAICLAFAPRVIGFGLGVASLVAVIGLAVLTPAGTHLEGWFLGIQVVPFLVDDFTRLIGLGLAFLGVWAIVYAYASDASRVMTAFGLAYIGSSIGAAFAGDWLVMVFMVELMAVTSTLLVWHYGGEAVRAGYRYSLAHGIAGNLLLLAVVWHYVETGTVIFEGGIAPGIPMFLAAAGLGINVAFIGFHTWLPDTYPRPHFAASVFLSVYTTKTSAYILYRAFPDGHLYIAYMGGAMAVFGVVFALLQHDMRALLSYHIQAQLGYIVAGIGLGTTVGVVAAMAHLFNNVLFKSLLFMAVGVVIYRTGENDLYKLGGLWREMPWTAVAFAIGALSITAMPGFNGFISKGMLLDTASGYFGGEEYRALYWLLYIGAVGTLLSFIKLGYYVFFHGESDRSVADATAGRTIAMLAVGGACILIGVWWQGFVDLLPMVEDATIAGDVHLHPYSTSHLIDAFELLAIASVGFVLIRKPLATLEVKDPAMLVNPAGFYLGRWSMQAVTESYAAIDAVAVLLVKRCYWAGANPVSVVSQTAERVPGLDTSVDPDESTLQLRASIGTSVMLITILIVAALVIVL
ncbi:MAG: Na(+)/H(+) antiporter subunit D [Natrialbaceae archaeon]|nr:Na(+)/H(+) antiporter subunit D [Natrialbaceae archaeon]